MNLTGDYFHNYEEFPEAKVNDDFKRIQCEAKNIKLIVIWEHDWQKKKDEVKDLLKEEVLK